MSPSTGGVAHASYRLLSSLEACDVDANVDSPSLITMIVGTKAEANWTGSYYSQSARIMITLSWLIHLREEQS